MVRLSQQTVRQQLRANRQNTQTTQELNEPKTLTPNPTLRTQQNQREQQRIQQEQAKIDQVNERIQTLKQRGREVNSLIARTQQRQNKLNRRKKALSQATTKGTDFGEELQSIKRSQARKEQKANPEDRARRKEAFLRAQQKSRQKLTTSPQTTQTSSATQQKRNDQRKRERAQQEPGIFRLSTGEIIISQLQNNQEFKTKTGKTIRVGTPPPQETPETRTIQAYNLFDPQTRKAILQRAESKKFSTTEELLTFQSVGPPEPTPFQRLQPGETLELPPREGERKRTLSKTPKGEQRIFTIKETAVAPFFRDFIAPGLQFGGTKIFEAGTQIEQLNPNVLGRATPKVVGTATKAVGITLFGTGTGFAKKPDDTLAQFTITGIGGKATGTTLGRIKDIARTKAGEKGVSTVNKIAIGAGTILAGTEIARATQQDSAQLGITITNVAIGATSFTRGFRKQQKIRIIDTNNVPAQQGTRQNIQLTQQGRIKGTSTQKFVVKAQKDRFIGEFPGEQLNIATGKPVRTAQGKAIELRIETQSNARIFGQNFEGGQNTRALFVPERGLTTGATREGRGFITRARAGENVDPGKLPTREGGLTRTTAQTLFFETKDLPNIQNAVFITADQRSAGLSSAQRFQQRNFFFLRERGLTASTLSQPRNLLSVEAELVQRSVRIGGGNTQIFSEGVGLLQRQGILKLVTLQENTPLLRGLATSRKGTLTLGRQKPPVTPRPAQPPPRSQLRRPFPEPILKTPISTLRSNPARFGLVPLIGVGTTSALASSFPNSTQLRPVKSLSQRLVPQIGVSTTSLLDSSTEQKVLLQTVTDTIQRTRVTPTAVLPTPFPRTPVPPFPGFPGIPPTTPPLFPLPGFFPFPAFGSQKGRGRKGGTTRIPTRTTPTFFEIALGQVGRTFKKPPRRGFTGLELRRTKGGI